MAKYYNNKIKTGRLAGSVFAVRYGEVIERAYNPIVANPQTEGQVAARAKLKLLSQLGAVLGETIAMPRVGAVSTRNLFVKANYPTVTYTDDTADIDIPSIKVTNSAVGLAPLRAVRSTGNIITASLIGGDTNVDRVVYIQVQKDADGDLRVVGTFVKTKDGDANFTQELNPADLDTYVLAYGIRDNSDRARTTFGNMFSPTAEDVARIIVTRVLTNADVTLTETRGIEVSAA